MTAPAFDPEDLGTAPRPGSYEEQLATWAHGKLAQGVDPDLVRAKVGDQIHAYRASLANRPDAPAPETTGDAIAGAMSAAYQGLTMGAGNKITAGIRTVLPQALGGTKGFDFPEALKEQTGVLEDFKRNHPVASTVTELAGSIPSVMVGGGGAAAADAGKLAKAVALMKSGAAYGATSGALSSNRLADVPVNAITGAGEGAVIAPTLGAAGGWLARGGANVLRKMMPAAAGDALAGKVGAAPSTAPEQANAALVGALRKGGVDPATVQVPTDSPTSAMELGSRNVMTLARQARNVPTSDAGQNIDRFLTERAAGAGQRIEGAVTGATGITPTDVQEPVEQIIARRAQEAKPLYDKAYEYGPIQDPETLNQIAWLRQHPVFASAWNRGQQLGSLEGGAPTAGPPGIDPARWKELQAQGLDKFIPQGQTPTPTAGPTVKDVDYWKRGLDAQIESGAGSGNALSRTEARVYRQKLNDVLGRVDTEVPDYGAARASFKGNSELAEAADAGGQHFSPASGTADYLKRTLPDMSDAEQEVYRANALNQFVAKVRNVAANPDLPESARSVNIPQRVMGTADAGAKLRLLFPTQPAYDGFLAQMEQEALYPKTKANIMNQSSTAAQQQEAGVNPSTWRDAAMSAMGSPFAKMRLGAKAIGAMTGAGRGMSPAVADAVGRNVTSTGISLQDLLRQAATSQEARTLARQRLNALLGNLSAEQSQNGP